MQNIPEQSEQSVSNNPGANALKIKKEMYIDLVRKLMIRGVKSAIDIQKALAEMDPPLNVTTRSIYRYKGILAKRTAHEVKTKHGIAMTVVEMAHKLRETFEEVTRELWIQYHNPAASPRTKVAALAQIGKITEDHTKLLQSMGLVNAAPTKHQMVDKDGNPMDPPGADSRAQMIAEWDAFLKAKYQDPVGSDKQAEETKPKPLPVPPVN